MADRFNIELLGDRRLSQQLANLPARVERDLLSASLREGAMAVLRDARRRIRSRTGLLAGGLYIHRLRYRRGRVGWSVNTPGRARIGLLPEELSYYPAHVELGHRIRRRRGAAALARRLIRLEFGSRRVRPHPYLRPALVENREVLLRIIGDDLRLRIEEELA